MDPQKRKLRNWLIGGLSLLASIILLLIVVADKYVEPILRQRLHTLIIEGSDSLYTYQLGDLRASFFGGNVEIDELHIQVDSNRYYQLKERNALPSLTLQLDMQYGHIRGLSVLPLLLGKKIALRELKSDNANIRLIRQTKKVSANTDQVIQPFWQAIEPSISRITIDRVRLNGMKLLYRSADTALSMKLQFDTCHAELDNIRIDSIGAFDTSRIGFAKDVYLVFRDLKFRTADSASKMKAESFEYSSRTRELEITEFKVQPTLKEKGDYYNSPNRRESMSVVNIKKAKFTGFRLERYLRDNFFIADSLLMNEPEISVYTDKTFPPFMQSKVGSFPHQKLLQANSYIAVKGVAIRNASLQYTEKAEKTKLEGTIKLSDLNITISNLTNDPGLIKKQPKATAVMQGNILGNSPMMVNFIFHLDSTEGKFDANGWIRSVNAAALNPIALSLANTRLQSFDMHDLNFRLRGDDYGATGEVRMKYNNLFVVLLKTDTATGTSKTNNFFTNMMNKHVLYDSNPGPNGVERVARNVRKSRMSFQAFFGLVWKTIFEGMMNVMAKSGSYD